jgi:hypothetical protein
MKNILATFALALGMSTSAQSQTPPEPATGSGVWDIMLGTQGRAAEIWSLPPIKYVSPDGNTWGWVQINSLRGVVLTWWWIIEMGDNGAMSIDIKVGSKEKEILTQFGINVDEGVMIKISFAYLSQFMEFMFPSGKESARLQQSTLWWTLRIQWKQFVKFLEAYGYIVHAPSKEFGTKEYSIDTASLFQLFEYRARAAGSTTIWWGLKAEVIISEADQIFLNFSAWLEQSRQDTLIPSSKKTNITGGVSLRFPLSEGIRANVWVSLYNKNPKVSVGISNDASDEQRNWSVKVEKGQKWWWTIGVNLRVRFHTDFTLPESPQKKLAKPNNWDRVMSVWEGDPGPVLWSQWAEKNPEEAEKILRSTYVPPIYTQWAQTPEGVSVTFTSKNGDLKGFIRERSGFVPSVVNAWGDGTSLPVKILEVPKLWLVATWATVDTKTGDILIPLPTSGESIVQAKNSMNGRDVSHAFSIVNGNILMKTRSLAAILSDEGIQTIDVDTQKYRFRINIKIKRPSIFTSITRIDKQVDNPTIASDPVATVSGNSISANFSISDADGLLDPTCQLQDTNGNLVGSAVTPQLGICTFLNVPPWTYRVRVSWSGVQKNGFATSTIRFEARVSNLVTVNGSSITPPAPAVTANDVTNTIDYGAMTPSGIADLEYSTNGGVTYFVSVPTIGTGNLTVLVRVKAQGINPASAPTTLNFTTDPDTTPPSLTSPTNLGTVNIGTTNSYLVSFSENVASISVGALPTGMTGSLTGSGNSRILTLVTTAAFTSYGAVSIPLTYSDGALNTSTTNLSLTINDVAPNCSVSGIPPYISDNGGGLPIWFVGKINCSDTLNRALNYQITSIVPNNVWVSVDGNWNVSLWSIDLSSGGANPYNITYRAYKPTWWLEQTWNFIPVVTDDQ